MTLQLATGSLMPLTGFGTWRLRAPELEPAIREAIRVGYRHFDGAAIYENEAELGPVFHSIINTEKLIPRSEVCDVCYYCIQFFSGFLVVYYFKALGY